MNLKSIIPVRKAGGLKKFPFRFGKLGLKIQKHSPELLMATGVVGFVGTVVFASRATLKADKIIMPEHYEKLETIDKALELAEVKGDDRYVQKDATRDKVVVYVQTSAELGRTYAPAIVLGVSTVACFLGAYKVISRRNAALAAAYTIVEGAFSDYRQRVVEELGEVWDHHFRYGGEMEETSERVEDPETGKKKTIKKFTSKLPTDLEPSMYAVIFEPIQMENGKNKWRGSSQFINKHEYNYFFLTTAQSRLNDRLKADGYLFLNDVYEQLGFPRTEAGQIVGWVIGHGDDRVIFTEALDLYTYDDGSPILLDFNVDGPILDLI